MKDPIDVVAEGSVGAAMALRIPYAALNVFEFSGHAAYIEEPELFLHRVGGFYWIP